MASVMTSGALGHTLGEQSHVGVGTEACHAVCRGQRWQQLSVPLSGAVCSEEGLCRPVTDGICVSLCSLLCIGEPSTKSSANSIVCMFLAIIAHSYPAAVFQVKAYIFDIWSWGN